MKYVKLLLVLVLIIFSSSCSRYEELNNLSIISNIEIKYSNKKYIVIMQEIIPKKNDNSFKYDYSYRSGIGNSISSAFSGIIDHSPKKIYLKNVQNIIIEKKNYKKIINKFIKYQLKNENISKNSSIIVSTNSLKNIMKINNDYKYIDSILKEKKITLKYIFRDYKKNKRIKIPLLKIKNDEFLFKKYIYL
ncbi:MAG: hypothetical protein IK997_03115 [Bacilli bacterium]|nr:hypothetical protein [Bacilli bacterium]